MRHRTSLTYIAALVIACAAANAAAQPTQIDVYYSPNGGATHAVATAIAAAKKTVRVATYSISEEQITTSLLAAHQRGLTVQMIADRGQQNDRYSTAPHMKTAGLQIVVDNRHQLFHNKYIIIDDAVVVTGSMNFTASGDRKNAENTLIIHDEATAAKYAADFVIHFAHADGYTVRHSRGYVAPPTPPNLDLSTEPAHAQEP